METTTETKPLTKHIQTAVNAIQKQIDKYESQCRKIRERIQVSENEYHTLQESIAGLEEQISKLKGE